MRVLYQDDRVTKRQRPTSGCVYKAVGKLPGIRSKLKVPGFGLVLYEDHNCTCSTRLLGNLVASDHLL